MRAIAGPGHVSNEFVDYDAVTNPNGTVVTADWANDVQEELLGIQTAAGIAEAAGTNEYVLAAIEYLTIKNSHRVGQTISIPGNYRAPTEFDKDSPDTFFPAVCLTDFDDTKVISSTNYPLLVPQLRSEKLIYLEELTGEASTFAGTASGSVVTLTSPNDANEDLAAGMLEWFNDMGAYPAVVISGTTYEVTNVNSVTLEFTLGAAPGDGAVTLEVYPHRIAASTTTARLWSWVGKTAIGAGTTETLAMMMRRDQMQGHIHSLSILSGAGAVSQLATDVGSTIYNRLAQGGATLSSENLSWDPPSDDGANGTPRTGTTTHSPDVAVHWYMWAGVVTGL